MVSVEVAKSLVSKHTPTLSTHELTLNDGLGFVLAEDVVAGIDMPPFPQSAMDGYALGGPFANQENRFSEDSTYKIIGEVAAGSAKQFELKERECVRIFTGAPVPESAFAVVQQEWVERNGDQMSLTQEVKASMHIRPQGEQMKREDVALEKGTLLNAAAIGFLAMIGVTEVEVFNKPKVAVLVTGNELVKPGTPLEYGQIYESNSAMLVAALKNEGIDAECVAVPDDFEQTKTAITQAMTNCDLLIMSGGISVGDHDHVGKALIDLGTEQLFYKVKQKPGKPLFFGKKGEKLVFALPGNPGASLSCYYEYVQPAIRRMQHHPKPEQTVLRLPLATDFINKGGRSQFLKAKIIDSKVELLGGQSSAMLSTFAVADALVYIPSEIPQLGVGEIVEVHLLT
ncbi:MAG: molybdopterin molybdotransferase [Bacteroidia bacterium]|jgi:molybdopterin molybdotransferase